MNVPTLEESNKSNRKEKHIKNAYPEFYEFLNEKYSHIDNYKDRISVFLHGLEDIPKCPVCGNRVKYKGFKRGYDLYCSQKCSNGDIIKKQKIKDSCIRKYGVDSFSKTETYKEKCKNTKLERYGDENYNNKEKNKATCLERYGVECYTQTDEYKDRHKATCLERYGVDSFSKTDAFKERFKNTKLERYGDENYINKEKRKITCLERYGVENYSKTEEYIEKSYNTKKKNGTFNSSKIEELFKEYLIANNIEFKSQYKSDLYPFSCDFYIPSKDLYIEIQASWTHGEHPFNENDIDDIKKLKLWQSKDTDFYKNAIHVWTVRDPLKRETAKKNGVRLLEVFSNDIKELISIFERYLKE